MKKKVVAISDFLGINARLRAVGLGALLSTSKQDVIWTEGFEMIMSTPSQRAYPLDPRPGHVLVSSWLSIPASL